MGSGHSSTSGTEPPAQPGALPARWEDMVLVGRVTKVHGLRGDVVVAAETDFPEARFSAGATVWCGRSAGPSPMVVAAGRFVSSRLVVRFNGVDSIDQAEALVGCDVRVPEAALLALPPGAVYHHQLVGCVVRTVAGEPVGTVTRVDGGTGVSTLVIDGDHGEVLVPFATSICVEVDTEARCIRIDPPVGLLDVNAASGARPRRRRRRGATGPGTATG